MKICVCIKQVPDSWSQKQLDPDSLNLDRNAADRVISEGDVFAIEEAVRKAEQFDGEVTVVSMGPSRAADSLRKALALGVNHAALITDEALAGADALATSLVLASYLKPRDFDLILFGSASTDAGMGVIPSMVGTRLNVATLTMALGLEIESGIARVQRVSGFGIDELSAPLPVVVSVTDKINTPRMPNFKAIMASKKAEIEEISLSDLGLTSNLQSATKVHSQTLRPPRSAGRIVDKSGALSAIEDFLIAKKFI